MLLNIPQRLLQLIILNILLFTFQSMHGNVHENLNCEKLLYRAFKTYPITASDTHRYIWFRNAKVCTRTIFDVLMKNSVFSINGSTIPFNDSLFPGYFKFAFVRNPWDRVVSCYLNKISNCSHIQFSECFGKGFDYFIYFICRQDLSIADRHIRLQVDLLPIEQLDFIGRFENFEADFRYVLNVLDISQNEIPHKNATNHKHYSTYYNDVTRELIRDKYIKDIHQFNYQFESLPNDINDSIVN